MTEKIKPAVRKQQRHTAMKRGQGLTESLLRAREAQLEIELADAQLLHSISAAIVHEESAQLLYEKLVDAAMRIMRSDFGSLQLLYPERGELRLLAAHGFNPQSTRLREWVRADTECACGQALRTGVRVIVPDVEKCEFMAGTESLAVSRDTGVRSVQSTPLYSRAGRLLGMISTHWRRPHQPSERNLRLLDILSRQVSDFIERRQTEDALRLSEERSRAIVNQATVGIAQGDLRGNIILANDRFCQIIGYAREELIGMCVSDVTHPDDLSGNLDQLKRMLDTGESFVVEKRYLRKDGSIVWVSNSVTLLRDAAGIPLNTLIVTVDISEHKWVEQELRASEARARFILDSMPQKIFTARRDGEVDYVNRTWLEYTGLSFDELRNPGRVVHPEDLDKCLQAWQRSLQSGKPFECAQRFRRHDGEYRWHMTRVQPMHNAEGRLAMWIGSNADIHELKLQEAAHG